MLRGARLVANCNSQEFRDEVDKLTDPTVPYVPKVLFKIGVRPVGVSHQMQAAKSCLWASELLDADAQNSLGERPAMLAAPQPSNQDRAVEVAADDEAKLLGLFQQGGNSGSGSSSAASSAIPAVPVPSPAVASVCSEPVVHENPGNFNFSCRA
jgi:hypothetical protein